MKEEKYKHISELKNWELNPRAIREYDFDRLLKQIKKLGQYKPVLATLDGEVIGGNMRLNAYKALGMSDIWVSEIEPVKTDRGWQARLNGEMQPEVFESKEQVITEYALSDNDRAGYYVEDQLAELLHNSKIELKLYHFDLGASISAEDLLDRYRPTAEDDFNPSEAMPEEPKSKYGDIYRLGEHRLMCGDATLSADVDKLMQSEKADMVFTDPPYNVDYTGGMGEGEQHERERIMNDSMSEREFAEFMEKVCAQIVRVAKGGVYICMSSSELGSLKAAWEIAGGHWQSFIIWVKNQFTLSRADYQHTYEPILYGWPKNINHYFVGSRDNPNVWEDLAQVKTSFDGEYTTIKFHGFEVKVKGKAEGEVKQKKMKTDIWRYDKPNKSEEHPTMKPIRLCAEAIKNSSHTGQIVLDLFGGSGSTLIACEQMKRKCRMMELDPKYVDVIIARWETLTGEKAEKVSESPAPAHVSPSPGAEKLNLDKRGEEGTVEIERLSGVNAKMNTSSVDTSCLPLSPTPEKRSV